MKKSLKNIKTKKYPKGGEIKPIVVNDPNDPRLKAYQDSLRAYNLGNTLNDDATMFTKNVVDVYNKDKHFWNPTAKYVKKENYHTNTIIRDDLGDRKYPFQTETFLSNVYNAGVDSFPSNTPINWNGYSTNIDAKEKLGVGLDMQVPVWKKPVQPIVYQAKDKTPVATKPTTDKEFVKYYTNKDEYNKALTARNDSSYIYNKNKELQNLYPPPSPSVKEVPYSNSPIEIKGNLSNQHDDLHKDKKVNFSIYPTAVGLDNENRGVYVNYKKPVVIPKLKKTLKVPYIASKDINNNTSNLSIYDGFKAIATPTEKQNIQTYTAAGYPMIKDKIVPKGYVNKSDNLQDKSNAEYSKGGLIPQYKLGDVIKDAGVFGLDNIMSIGGFGNVADNNGWYSNDKFGKKLAGFQNNVMTPVTEKAAQVVAGIYGGPAASAALGALQQAGHGIDKANTPTQQLNNTAPEWQQITGQSMGQAAGALGSIIKKREGGQIFTDDMAQWIYNTWTNKYPDGGKTLSKQELFNKYYGQVSPFEKDNSSQTGYGFDYMSTKVEKEGNLTPKQSAPLVNKMINFLQKNDSMIKASSEPDESSLYTNPNDILNSNLYSLDAKRPIDINTLKPIQPFGYGQEQYAMGGQTDIQPAQLEKQENVLLPNGETQQYNLPSHEQQSNNNVNAMLPPGTMVFSDKLKLGNKTFADVAKKFRTDKFTKIAEDKNSSPIDKQTAEKMVIKNNAKLQDLFNTQESMKQEKFQSEFKKKLGGLIKKYGVGGGPKDDVASWFNMPEDNSINNVDLIQPKQGLQFNPQSAPDLNNRPTITPQGLPQLNWWDKNQKQVGNYAGEVGKGLLNNFGNLYYLAKEGKSYDKVIPRTITADNVSGTEAINDAKQMGATGANTLREAFAGNAGQLLSAIPQNTLQTGKVVSGIRENVNNTNVGINNATKQFNSQVQTGADIAEAQNKGQALTNYYEAINGTGQNVAQQIAGRNFKNMDRATLDAFLKMYPGLANYIDFSKFGGK
jgi:hypothetical protein